MNDDFDSIFDYNTNTTASVEAEQPEQHDPTPEVTETPEQHAPEADIETAVAELDSIEERDEEEKLPETVPIAVFLDVKSKMRNKLKAEQDRAAEYERQLASYQKPVEAPSIPDPYNDPHGFAEHNNNAMRVELLNQKMQMSHAFALQRHDPAEVAAAIEWAKPQTETDPAFDAAVANSPDPISMIIQQHKAHQKQQETAALLTEFNNDPLAAARKIALEQGWIASDHAQVAQAPVATQPKAAKVRPTSLKDIPTSTSKVTPQATNGDFDSIFNIR